jgi:hypothetical protein
LLHAPRRCAGVLARITLASLLVSSCPHCRCCAGVVAELAFEGPDGAALAFAGVALAFCPHCAGVIASIVLSSLLPALRRRHHPRCVGAFSLVALALLPSLPSRRRQHRELGPVTKQSRHALASLPALRHRCCQHCAGIVALVAWASLPSLRWCCRPWHTRVAASITNWHPASHDAVSYAGFTLVLPSFIYLNIALGE